MKVEIGIEGVIRSEHPRIRMAKGWQKSQVGMNQMMYIFS
jgi:hypothetical protein